MDIKDFKINRLNSTYGVLELIVKDVDLYSVINTTPTMNCQLYSIGGVDAILDISDIQLKKDIFNLIQKEVNKNILLVDININYKDSLFKVLNKESIINEIEYTSTNGTSMIIILLKTIKLT